MKRKFFYDKNYRRKRRYGDEANYDTSGNPMGSVYNPDNERQFYDYGGKPFNPDITDFTDDLDYTKFWNSPLVYNYPHGPVYERKRARYLDSIETRPLVSGDVVGKKIPIRIRPKDLPTFTPRAETLENNIKTKKVDGKTTFNANKFEAAKKPKKNITFGQKNDPVKSQQFRDDMAFKQLKQDFYSGYDMVYQPDISEQNRLKFQARMNKSGLAREVDYIMEHPDVLLDKKVDRNVGIQMLPFLFEERAMYDQFKAFVRESQRGENIYEIDTLNNFNNRLDKIHDDVVKGKYSPGVGNAYMMHAMMGFYTDMIKKDRQLADQQFKKTASKEAMMQEMKNYKQVFDNEFAKMSKNIKDKIEFSIRGLKQNNAVHNAKIRNQINEAFKRMGVDINNLNTENMRKLNDVVNDLVTNQFKNYQPNVTNIYQVVQEYNDNPIVERINKIENEVSEKLSDIEELDKMKEEIQNNNAKLNEKIEDVGKRVVRVEEVSNNTVKNLADLTEIVNNDRKQTEDVKRFIKSMGSSGFWNMLKGNLGVDVDDDLLHAIKMMDSSATKKDDGKIYTHLYGLMKDLYVEGQKTIGKDLADMINAKGNDLTSKINKLNEDIKTMETNQAKLAEQMAAKIDVGIFNAKKTMDENKFNELQQKLHFNANDLAVKGRKIDYISSTLENLNRNINEVSQQLANDETKKQLGNLQNEMNNLYNNVGIRLLNGDVEALTKFVNIVNSNNGFVEMLKKNVNALIDPNDFNAIKENVREVQNSLGNVKVQLEDGNLLQKMVDLMENKWNITQRLEQTNNRISGLMVGNGLFSPEHIKNTIADFLTADPMGIALMNDMVHGSLLYGDDYWNDNQQSFKILDNFVKQQQVKTANLMMNTQRMNEQNYGYDNFWNLVLRNYHPDESPIINSDDMIKRYKQFNPAERQFVDRAINLWHVLKDNYQNKLSALPLQMESNTYLRSPLMNYLQQIPVYVATRNRQTNPNMNEFRDWFMRHYNEDMNDTEEAVNDLIRNDIPLVKAVNDVMVGGNDYQRLINEMNRDWERPGGLRDYYIARYGKRDLLALPAQSEIEQIQNYARSVNQMNPGWSFDDIVNNVRKYGPIYILDPEKVTYKKYYDLTNKNVQSRDLVKMADKSLVTTGVKDVATVNDNEILDLMENRFTKSTSSNKRNVLKNVMPGTSTNPINVNDDPIMFVTNQAIDEIKVGTYNDGSKKIKAAKIKMAPGQYYKKDRNFAFKDWDINKGDTVTFTPHAQKIKDVTSIHRLASRRQEDFDDRLNGMHITSETKSKLHSFRPSRYHSSKVTQHSEKYPFAFKD